MAVKLSSTSWEVSVSPLWKRMPLRSSNVHTLFPSAVSTVQRSASSGAGFISESSSTTDSNISWFRLTRSRSVHS